MCILNLLLLIISCNVILCLNFFRKGFTDFESSNETACIYHCLDMETSFFQCMQNCSNTWMFIEGNCSNPLNAGPVNDTSIQNACNPFRNSVKISTFHKKMKSGQVFEFFYLEWDLCQAAIDRLRGYKISFTSDDASQCYVLLLQLTGSDRLTKMWFVAPIPLQYTKYYKIELLALPYYFPANSLLFQTNKTAKCSTLNGPHSCFCDFDLLNPPNITVEGYSVLIQFQPALHCFSPKFYQLLLCFNQDCNSVGPPINYVLTQPENDSITLKHRFSHVFDSSAKLWLTIQTFYASNNRSINTTSYPVHIKAWLPPKPNITNFGSHEYEAWFQLPPSDFIVDSYMFRIGHYDRKGSILQLKSIYKEYEVKASQLSDTVRQKFILVEGMYGIQIREVRSESETSYFNGASWGPVKVIMKEPDDIHLLTIVGISSCIALLGIVFIIFISMLRAGKCFKCKKFVPSKFYDVAPQSVSKKTVLLVWQSDFRSKSLYDLYKELVRSFGSFLALECGLEVIIDQCEEIDLSNSYAQWISNSVERADIVIFVCPHFDYSKLNGKSQSCFGNFTNAFSYMERSILSDQQKYVCVKFPFADLSLNSHTKFLYNLITSFEMMNEIEDLYFRIQGISKKNLFVRKVVGNINKSWYVNSEVGRELHQLMTDFNNKLKTLNDHRYYDSYPRDSIVLLDNQDPDPGGDFYPIPVNLASLLDSTYEQETPLMVQSLSNVAPILESNSPVLKPRSRLEPIVPFTKDPNQAIREMNEASGSLSCDLQNLSSYRSSLPFIKNPEQVVCVIYEESESSFYLSQYQSSSLFGNPNHFENRNKDWFSSHNLSSSFSSRSDDLTASCFHTNELDSISTSSHHQDEKSQSNLDAKIDETSPKSPAVHSNVEEFDEEVGEHLLPAVFPLNPVVDGGVFSERVFQL